MSLQTLATLPSFFPPGTSNAEIFSRILKFYVPPGQGKRVLDATAGKREFWRRVQGDLFNWSEPYDTTFMDIAKRPSVDLQATYTVLPFKPRTFDCVIYDPPFAGKQNKLTGSKQQYVHWMDGDESFGFNKTTARYLLETRKFGIEAARVLVTHGLLISKCMDLGRRFIHMELPKFLHRFKLIDVIVFATTGGKPLRPGTRRGLKQSHKLHSYFQVWEKFGR